ncbi:Integrase, catalytic core protein [Phytophthora megakarya]|uniref:Integrase, catalytic core protein n=1 Tax=Phytophthora megakarya TaxID=4795 RepID=A0A225X000_9STRA|nr:Integrase, catalytic core protein [Phytophthora megakarya]
MKNGFKSCGVDQCVYVKCLRNRYVYVCLYVDDMIIAAKTSDEIREATFKMKELGAAKFIFDMDIDHDKEVGTLMIKQACYIDDVAERFGQRDVKPVYNSCDFNLKVSKTQSLATDAERAEMRSEPYRSLVGCLLNITTCRRPDVACVVTQLSRFLANPGLEHWRPKLEFGFVYDRGSGEIKAEACTDADWGSSIDDRGSVSGVLVMIGNGPVVFKSKFQRTVALSSAEAEYMALSLCTQEVSWARAILKEMGHEQREGTQVWKGPLHWQTKLDIMLEQSMLTSVITSLKTSSKFCPGC